MSISQASSDALLLMAALLSTDTKSTTFATSKRPIVIVRVQDAGFGNDSRAFQSGGQHLDFFPDLADFLEGAAVRLDVMGQNGAKEFLVPDAGLAPVIIQHAARAAG